MDMAEEAGLVEDHHSLEHLNKGLLALLPIMSVCEGEEASLAQVPTSDGPATISSALST